MRTPDDMRAELRTQEALGDGTDVRLVVLEVALVCGRLGTLDAWIGRLAGRERLVSDEELQVLLCESDVFDRLAGEWEGIDLQEVTMRLREVDDLLELLLSGADDAV